MGFTATIEAKKLKHVFSVLRMATAEAVFEIDETGLHSIMLNADNSMACSADIPVSAFDNYYPSRDHKINIAIGVDLEEMALAIEQASANELIEIELKDDKLWLAWGTNRQTIPMLVPDEVRNVTSTVLNISITAEINLIGQQFKESVAESVDLGGEVLQITADGNDRTFYSETDRTIRYCCTTYHEDTYLTVLVDAMYDVALLAQIAKDIHEQDDVTLRYATDLPCSITYERDGVSIEIILAPRIAE